MAKANIADVKRCEEVEQRSAGSPPAANQRFVLQVIQPGLAGLMIPLSVVQVVIGGLLVFASGVLIGTS